MEAVAVGVSHTNRSPLDGLPRAGFGNSKFFFSDLFASENLHPKKLKQQQVAKGLS